MARHVDVPEEFKHKPFRVTDAERAGLSRVFLSGPNFRAPFPGVRVPCHLPDTLSVRCEAASLIVPDDAAFSHRTAASICELPLPAEPKRQDDTQLPGLDVTVPPEVTVPQVGGLTGHTGLDIDDVFTLDGLRLVKPERTFFHLAPTMRLLELVIVGDAIVRNWAPLETLVGRASGLSRHRGIVSARTALRYVKPNVDSAMETRVRMLLISAGLPCPAINVDVFNDSGWWVARPDLSYPHLKIAIEYDGDHHRTEKQQWRRDRARDEGLRHAGWIVITLTAEDVIRHPRRTVERIARYYRERSAAQQS